MKSFKPIEQCRICGETKLDPYLDLGETPLANAYLKDPETPEDFYPLAVLLCPRCHLSQLSVVVDPKILFGNYAYRSSISKTFREHCRKMAQSCKARGYEPSQSFVVDIASNDGCLLSAFKEEGFSQVTGVEPASNIAAIARQAGISTVNAFWSTEVAQELSRKQGRAQLITATNVLAHVDDLNHFVSALTLALDEKGMFVFEVPYGVDFIEKLEWDTIYHEHLSYFLLKPLVIHFAKYDMQVFDIEKNSIHGGSLRVFVKRASNKQLVIQPCVEALLAEEEKRGYFNKDIYRLFAKRVAQSREDLRHCLHTLTQEGKKVVGFAATAKGNTLLNYCGIGPELLPLIVDDTPEKQNRYTPGRHIPIRGTQVLQDLSFDYLLLLAWNFKEEIIRKTDWFQKKGGRYILPIPKVTIV